MRTNVQVAVEQQRAVYEYLRRPLLSQMARIHGLTVRDISTIFNISKSHAADILSHKKEPTLELAFRLARYFEVTVDDLFGWRFDDEGSRRPLVIELSSKILVRLQQKLKSHGALSLIAEVAEEMKKHEHDLSGN